MTKKTDTPKNDVGLVESTIDLVSNQRDRAGNFGQRVNVLLKDTDLSPTAIAAIVNDKLPPEKHLTGTDILGASKSYEACESTIPLSAKTTRGVVKDQKQLNKQGGKLDK